MVKCYKTKNLDSYYLEMGATEGFLKGEIKTLVDKLRDKEEEIKKLKEIRDNREEKIADLEIEICKLKEEKDNFMLKYSKALEEKIVQTNNICTERNKLVEENKKLKDENEYRAKVVDITPQNEKSVAEETIQDLQERIRFLEQCLDNKEKVNISLREELQRYKDMWDSGEF